jgi:hypothetical protein
MAVCQLALIWLIRRYREQARSHKYLWCLRYETWAHAGCEAASSAAPATAPITRIAGLLS